MVTDYEPYWSRFAFDCLAVGVISALIAATFGLIDYLSVNMSSAGRRLATYHMIINVSAVVLYAIGGWLRWSYAPVTNLWVLKFILDIVPFAILGFSGWLGGKMSYQHKIGVVENYDLEATEIGQRESDSSGARPGILCAVLRECFKEEGSAIMVASACDTPIALLEGMARTGQILSKT